MWTYVHALRWLRTHVLVIEVTGTGIF